MDCIYLAAGLGIRMKESQPKQFLTILGKPILIYALEVLEGIEEIERILLLYNPDYKDFYNKIIQNYNISKVELIKGGETRQESVFNGLKEAKSSKVIIHEAARPFISRDIIIELFSYPKEIAVIPSIPIPFTVSVGGDYMEGILEREKLHNIQLPQMFDTEMLLEAHKQAIKDNYTANEDGVLFFRNNKKVRFINGSESNIKITTPLDMIIAEELLKGIYQ